MSDDARKLILSRRARFVAAALAGLAADGCGKTTAPPDAGAQVDPNAPQTVPAVCLSAASPSPDPPDAEPVPSPAPCLTAAPPPPQPCLRVAPPHPCLKPPPPPKCDPPFTIDKDGKKRFKPECL